MGDDPIHTENFINRELSWLEFNQRVLEEARDRSNPLFERLKFLTIVSSNLDEFFMVRVASVRDQINAGLQKIDSSGLTPQDEMRLITKRAHVLVKDQYISYNTSLFKTLKKEEIIILKPDELNHDQLNYILDYFKKSIEPVLTPMVVDKSRPFPLILNKSLNIAALVADKQQETLFFATVQVPSVLERLVKVPSANAGQTFILLEDVIKMHLADLFRGYLIRDFSCYRITRSADLGLDEEGAEDLLEAIEQSLKQRKWGSVIRLEIEKTVNKRLLTELMDELEISTEEVYEINGPLDLTFLTNIIALPGYENFHYPSFQPLPPTQLQNHEDLFDAISREDILLHHPFYSFTPVLDLVRQAAADPRVLAIKQTLYRVSGHSPLIEALSQAAENGKQVTVLVELKARFDEQNNIHWAKQLEKAGCHVIYGLVGLKTHGKILLIVRREEEGIKRYVHLSTGNYNDVTANFYTDIGLMTANPYFGADASNLFNMLSGLSEPTHMYRLTLAPKDLRSKFSELIERETQNAHAGKTARITAKMNSLIDNHIIEKLYEASQAGVKIDLIVRGMCCLRPNVPDLSENITVRSIVGRFLEHSRIFYFYNDGQEAVYLSSADWMERNLNRRVEILFPIDDKKVKKELLKILTLSLKDNVKARIMNADGTYSRQKGQRVRPINSQQVFYERALNTFNRKKESEQEFKFLPILSNSYAN